MKISKRTFCEMIVRSYAVRYLGKEPDFELKELENVVIKDEPEDEFYSSAALVKAMMYLGLFNADREMMNIANLDSTVIAVSGDIKFRISFDDIIESLPDEGASIRRCKLCGKLFLSEYNNTEKASDEFCSEKYVLNYSCKELSYMARIPLLEKFRDICLRSEERQKLLDEERQYTLSLEAEIEAMKRESKKKKKSKKSRVKVNDKPEDVNKEADRLYNNAQKAAWMRKKKGAITEERYQDIKAELSEFKRQVKLGNKDLNEFAELIKQHRI